MTEIKYLLEMEELKQRVESLERENNELFERLEKLEVKLEGKEEDFFDPKLHWNYVWPCKK